MQRHFVTCPLCEACAGSRSHVEDEQVELIRADRDDVWTQGLPLPEGHDARAPAPRPRPPARADGPRRRRRWREVTWDEAFAPLRGAARTACSSATASTAITALHRQPDRAQLLARPLRRRCSSASRGCPIIYSAGTVDQWPKNVSCVLMYGEHVVDPDARHPAHRLLAHAWAATRRRRRAACSRAPTCSARSTRIRARGGKVVVIDPRRTGTADHADEWVPILPGTDAAFLLAIVQRAVRRGPRRPRRRSPTSSTASTRCARSRAEFTPERVEATCRRPGRRRSAGSRARSPPRRRARGLRPHRPVQPGVRHARVVAGRRREHPHRQLRPRPAA